MPRTDIKAARRVSQGRRRYPHQCAGPRRPTSTDKPVHLRPQCRFPKRPRLTPADSLRRTPASAHRPLGALPQSGKRECDSSRPADPAGLRITGVGQRRLRSGRAVGNAVFCRLPDSHLRQSGLPAPNARTGRRRRFPAGVRSPLRNRPCLSPVPSPLADLVRWGVRWSMVRRCGQSSLSRRSLHNAWRPSPRGLAQSVSKIFRPGSEKFRSAVGWGIRTQAAWATPRRPREVAGDCGCAGAALSGEFARWVTRDVSRSMAWRFGRLSFAGGAPRLPA